VKEKAALNESGFDLESYRMFWQPFGHLENSAALTTTWAESFVTRMWMKW
jgi:hypothetical protein